MFLQTNKKSLRFPYVFLILNLMVIIGIYFVLSQTMERALSSAIIQATQAGNSDITRIFINEVYPELHADLALTSVPTKVKSKLSEPELQRVDDRVRRFMFGTNVLKAKIYNINGITLYSSEASQIGDDKTGNKGFSDAARGIPASQVTHRGQFSALDGEVFDRDLVASYIPIRDSSDDIVGVAELYTDRSTEVQHSKELITELKSELIPALVSILFLVAVIVWRFTSYVTHLRLELLQRNESDI
ncbi:hypothetical protein [Neptuniibacter sp.]|uniref:hypothetical protein n=1 Tax=Neptuniibacter sp. TaxID=1962643 RepID=UPI0026366085|nr:hypothetical protein [Neptuniibacter sp.]MCP4598026.1 hypothetical protein [Neptuniibacter sp.]